MGHLVEITEKEFDLFSRVHEEGNYLQTLEMAKLLKLRGCDIFFLGIKENENVIAASLLSSLPLKVGKSFSIFGGPLIDYKNQQLLSLFLEEVKIFVKKHKGLCLTITPNCVFQYLNSDGKIIKGPQRSVHEFFLDKGFQHCGFENTYLNANPRVVFTKNLTGLTEKTLIKSYHSSTRTKVKKDIKSGMTFRRLLKEELPIFEEVMAHTANRQGFSDKGLAYYEAVYEAFGNQAHFMITEMNLEQYFQELQQKSKHLKEKIKEFGNLPEKVRQKENFQNELKALEKRVKEVKKFVRNENKKEVLSVGLFIERPQEMLFLFGGMYDQYKNFLSPSYFLQHIMLKQTIKKEIKRFNFYGIAGIYDGSDGVLNFKKGFEGIVEEQIGTYKIGIHPIKYKLYQILKTLKK